MYKLHLILKYLRRRRIAWVSLLAVMLCTTMVLVVISIMGGWLDMFENSARGLTGDVVIKGNGLSGFPHYEEMIAAIERDPSTNVAAASPTLVTWGVVNIANRKTDAVQVIGYKLDEIGKVNTFPQSLYRQHTKYVDEGKTPPATKTWDVGDVTEVPLAELPEGIKLFEQSTGRLDLGDPALAPLAEKLRYRSAYGRLSFRGRMAEDERNKLSDLSGEKAWRDAIKRLANESNWPGMIPSAGVLDIRKGKTGEITGRDDWKYDLWIKLTVVGVGAKQELDEKSKSERQYRIADDSRTGMWQYDMKTVYVPFETLQQDLGMDAKPITRLLTVFSSDSPQPTRVLGVAPEDGTYSLFKGFTQQPAETVELKAGQPLGFRKGTGDQMVAVAGDKTFDLGSGAADADWRFNKPDKDPARTTEIQIKVKDGADVYAARDRIKAIVDGIVERHPESFSPGDEPRVESWDQASALFINAIKKEKLLVTLLFAIISIVAIFLIFCIFYMIVAEKTKDIGIIKSVGATSGGVAGIFLGYGLAIGIVGTGLGLGLAFLIVRNINEIHDWLGKRLGVQVWNPEVYAFDKIPNQMNPSEVGVIISIAVLASVLGALVPAVRAARMHPVEALRWE